VNEALDEHVKGTKVLRTPMKGQQEPEHINFI
jgi:hypothetical protein